MTIRHRRPAATEAGFILIPVLVTLGLLAVIAMAVAKTTIVDVRTAAYQLRDAEAEALADGASRLVIRRIVADRVAGRGASGNLGNPAFPVDGRAVACSLPSGVAVIVAQDAGGLIDLNTAPRVLLERVLVSADVGKDEAGRLAAAIVDFRDFDDQPEPGGAETAEYRAAGRPFGPKNAPFASVGELDQVLGLTPAVLARIRPLVTVHSASRGIDVDVASPPLRQLGLPLEFAVPSNGRAFHLRVTAATTFGATFTREVVFEPNLRAPTGFVTNDWRRGERFDVGLGAAPAGCFDLARD